MKLTLKIYLLEIKQDENELKYTKLNPNSKV